jgi:hypothetical protein
MLGDHLASMPNEEFGLLACLRHLQQTSSTDQNIHFEVLTAAPCSRPLMLAVSRSKGKLARTNSKVTDLNIDGL